MTKQTTTLTIEILGKPYQIKCDPLESHSLQESALYLEKQMQTCRSTGKVLSNDRIAVITALNLAHQLLNIENRHQHSLQVLEQRIRNLQQKVEAELAAHSQQELASAE